jgi:hypothetical protein
VGVLLSTAALTASLTPGAVAGTKTWHILPVDKVEQARLTEAVIKNIDASITTVEFRKGGVGNIEICGFDRTEPISASRQARWTTAGTRGGTTLIMQFKKVADGGAAFTRLKQTYQSCTSADFQKPERTTVRYSFLKKKKQIRMVWALYTTAEKTEIQRAEGLSIKRAGGALIVTRTIVKDVADTTPLKMDKSVALTARQFGKYKAAAYF